MIVKRLLPNGTIAEFAATERWKENYAVKGGKEKSIAPNAMWTRRPYAQLAKCAEAQALRKAFPEFGAQPTADEMEGKTLDEGTVIDGSTGEVIKEKSVSFLPQDVFDKQSANWEKAIVSGKKTTDALIAWIEAKGAKLSESQLAIVKAWKPEQKEEKADAPAIDPDDLPFGD